MHSKDLRIRTSIIQKLRSNYAFYCCRSVSTNKSTVSIADVFCDFTIDPAETSSDDCPVWSDEYVLLMAKM